MKKILQIFVVLTMVFTLCSQGVTANNQISSVESNGDSIIEKITYSNQQFHIDLKEGVNHTEYQFALIEKPENGEVNEDELKYNSKLILDAESGKNYLLYIKNNINDEVIKLGIDSIAPSLEDPNIEYSDLDETNHMYKSAKVSVDVSDDTVEYSLKKANVEINDADIQLKDGKITFSLLDSDQYQLVIQDKFQNQTIKDIQALGVNQQLPDVSTKFEQNNWTQSIEVTIEPTDNNYEYALVLEGGNDDFKDKNVIPVTENGKYIPKIRLKDSGIVVEGKTIEINKIDNIAPIFEDNAITFNKDKTELTIHAQDKESGIDRYELYSSVNPEDKISSVNGQFSNLRRQDYKVIVYDKMGNTSTIDVYNTQPSLTFALSYENDVEKDGITYGNKATISAGSTALGTNTYALSTNTNEEQLKFGTDNSWDINESDTYYVFVKNIRDGQENISQPQKVNVHIDNQGPVIEEPVITSMYLKGKEYSNAKGFKISVKASDDIVGIKGYSISKNEKQDFVESNEENYEKVVTENGTYIIYVEDLVGNTSTKEVVISGIDTEAPKVEEVLLVSEHLNKTDFGTFTNSDLQVKVKLKDNLSGVQDTPTLILYHENQAIKTYTGSKDGEYYVFDIDCVDREFDMKLVAYDNVDNQLIVEKLTYDGTNENPILIDSKRANINKFHPMEKDQDKYKIIDGQLWITDDVDIEFDVSDLIESGDSSGIQSVSIDLKTSKDSVNVYQKTFNQKQNQLSDVIHTQDLTEKLDDKALGQFQLTLTVMDQAGNKTTKDLTLYRDFNGPFIEKTTAQVIDKNGQISIFDIDVKNVLQMFNGNVRLTVDLSDQYDYQTSSTIDSQKTLLTIVDKDGQKIREYKPVSIEENDIYIFEIDAEDMYFKMYIYAEDQLGNIIEDYSDFGKEINEINDKTIHQSIIDKKAPIISELNVVNDDVVSYDGKLWITHDVDFHYSITDETEKDCSGIANITILVNGEEYIVREEEFNKGIISKAEGTFNSADLTTFLQGTNGKLDIVLKVTDHAGNSTEKEFIVYRDFIAPSIDKVTIMPIIDAGKILFFDPDNFYMSNCPIDVTVYLNDTYELNSASGINGQKTYFNVKDSKGVVTRYEAEAIDAQKGIYKCRISVEDLFFKVYLVTEDNAGHTLHNEEIGKEIINANGSDFENIIVDHNNPTISSLEIIDGSSQMIDGKDWINKDVTLKYSVNDFVKNKDCSGLAQIKVEVNGYEIKDLGYDLSQSKNDSLNDILIYTKDLDSLNNGRIAIKITAKDNIGNTSVLERILYRDLDKPVFTYEYDNLHHDNQFTQYYKNNRTLTLTVKEMNFDADLVNVEMIQDKSKHQLKPQWKLISGTAGTIDAVYETSISFTKDADYQISIGGKDKVSHGFNTTLKDNFTIDKTKPTVSVTYNNNQAINGNYYDAYRTATIVLNEHNFESSRVRIHGIANDNGRNISFPVHTQWRRDGDKNIATIYYNRDGQYTFDIDYTDKAGNVMSDFKQQEFYIDTTKPEIEIVGVKKNSANAGEVVPIVQASDTNYDADKFNITLTGSRRGRVALNGKKSSQNNGEIFTFADMKKQKVNDDVYTIHASITDKAGNSSETELVYSVNRFGSTYQLSNQLKDMIDAKYIQKGQNIVFTEINVNKLTDIIVRLSVNGQIRELDSNEFTVRELKDGSWYRYVYSLNSSLFEKDGIYKIIITTKDAAGNVNENIIDGKNANIEFVIDKTKPIIAIAGVKSHYFYDENEKEVTIQIEDNLAMNDVEVMLNNEKIEIPQENFDFTIQVPEKSDMQSLKVIATDKAGNSEIKEIKDFTVSSNFFVRWYLNKPLFIGSLIVIGLAAIGITVFVKNKKATEENKTQS